MPFFCATNVGTAPLTVYMVLYDTAVLDPSFGIEASQTVTIPPLQTACLDTLQVPLSSINMWVLGVTIAAESNPAIVFTELQSLLVLAQLLPQPFTSEGTFLTPVLLNSVALPGNNAP